MYHIGRYACVCVCVCVCVHKVPYIKINSLQMADCELSVHCLHAVIWVAWYMCMRPLRRDKFITHAASVVYTCMYIHVLKVPYMSINPLQICVPITHTCMHACGCACACT